MMNTNFANSKKRVIRQGLQGGMYVMTTKGSKSYGPVAKFRKAANGALKKLSKANLLNVPNAIRPKRVAKATPTPMAPAAARKARMNAMAAKRNAGAMAAPRRRVRAAPKPRGMSNSARATKMFAKILNKQVAPPKAKANKVAKKNVIVVSPGGTIYKSKRSELALKRAAAQKKMRRQNPFAALNKALMR
tara:strand:- start:905 stop:1474 length:570 start_codon:yes stop_codon:yes gene_type:complete